MHRRSPRQRDGECAGDHHLDRAQRENAEIEDPRRGRLLRAERAGVAREEAVAVIEGRRRDLNGEVQHGDRAPQ